MNEPMSEPICAAAELAAESAPPPGFAFGPRAPASARRELPGWMHLLLIASAVLFCVALLLRFVAAPDWNAGRADAEQAAKSAVLRRLKSPGSAKFDHCYFVEFVRGEHARASLSVDSHNTFGALIRTRHDVALRYNAADGWVPITVSDW